MAEPLDRRLDRRLFLERMTRVTAAAVAGTAFRPRPLWAARPASKGPRGSAALPPPGSVQATSTWHMTLAELGSLLRDGALSPVELLDDYLHRIEAHDPVLQAFNAVPLEAARAHARRLGQVPWSGPLHGIPLAVKDNFYTRGVPTTANSRIFADFVPSYDATAWARLRGVGAVLVGKTQMGPLATSRATTPDGEPTTRNAWAPQDPSVAPGGSSSGSATAVAAGLAAASTGTQTGGSITNPAARQGLTGIKPTMGRVSLHGIIPLTYTRDHAGPLARDALDAALLLQAMAGPDPADPRTQGLPPVPDFPFAAQPVVEGSSPRLRWPTRIGVLPGYLAEEVDQERLFRFRPPQQLVEREARLRDARMRAAERGRARRRMLDTLASFGAEIVEIEPPRDWETLTSPSFNNVRLPERAEPFLEHLRRDVRLFGVSLAPWVNGLLLSGAEYLRGQRARMVLLERVLEEVFSRCDLVVQTSPIPFDMIGLPLISFPIGLERSQGMELPVGGLLGGPPFGEERLLSVAAAFQAVTDWHRRRAPEPDVAPGGDGGARGPLRQEAGRLDVLDVLATCE